MKDILKNSIDYSLKESEQNGILRESLKLHDKFLKGNPDGARLVIDNRNIKNFDFKGADLSRSIINWGSFLGCDFDGCKMDNAIIAGVRFTSCGSLATQTKNSHIMYTEGASVIDNTLETVIHKGLDTESWVYSTIFEGTVIHKLLAVVGTKEEFEDKSALDYNYLNNYYTHGEVMRIINDHEKQLQP